MEFSVDITRNIVIKDNYARSLAIYDHLNECLIIANKIKEKKNSIKTGEDSYTLECLKEHYKNELADLYILLEFEIPNSLVQERVDKFVEKANGK